MKMSVVIETTIGSMTVDLFTEERPRTCLNFLKLCKIKYYNFCPFHKIVKDFIAQCGRNIHNGQEGGESVYYFIKGDQGRFMEAESKPKLKHEEAGTLSMVTNDDRLIGSEFFVTLGKELDYLDGVHTVFGQVVEGLEVLYKLNEIFTDKEDKPYKDVLITHTAVLFDPFDDPEGLPVPDRSPEPSEELLNSNTIYIEQGYDENQGKTQEQLDEEHKDKEAKSRAIILEMIGDLPDAEVAPPDNVLFVCKLNAVTKDDDLRVIFSRFGKITDCEVIRDSKTDESLQYAFVEFQNPTDCEQAYLKMDNVLIDDRRIHVDFSQSVAKFKWKKKMSKDELANYDKNGRQLRSTSEEERKNERRPRNAHADRSREHDRHHDHYDRHQRNRSRSVERKYSRNQSDRNHERSRYHDRDSDRRAGRSRREGDERKSRRSVSKERKSRRDYSKERKSRRSRSRSREKSRRSGSAERKRSKKVR